MPVIPFYAQALLVLAAFVAVAGVLLYLIEPFDEEALDEQPLEQVDREVADVQPVAVVASEIRVSHGSQF